MKNITNLSYISYMGFCKSYFTHVIFADNEKLKNAKNKNHKIFLKIVLLEAFSQNVVQYLCSISLTCYTYLYRHLKIHSL